MMAPDDGSRRAGLVRSLTVAATFAAAAAFFLAVAVPVEFKAWAWGAGLVLSFLALGAAVSMVAIRRSNPKPPLPR